MTDHTLPPTGPNEDATAVTPIDPDIVLITDYLADALSPDERARVDERLEQDTDFHTKVWPLMVAWYAPSRMAQARAAGVAVTAGGPPRRATEADLDRVMRRFRHGIAWERAEEAVPARRFERSRRRWWQQMPAMDSLNKAYKLAVVATAMVFLPPMAYSTYAGMIRNAHERAEGRASTKGMRLPTVIEAPPVASAPPIAAAASEPKAAPAKTAPPKVVPVAAATAGAAPATGGVATAKVFAQATGESAAADSGDREVTLPGGTRVLLRAGSRYTSQHVIPPAGNQLGSQTLLTGALDGEAVIQVPDTGSYTLILTTPAANLMLYKGVFAIRCPPRATEALLTVERGTAWGFGLDMKRTDGIQIDSTRFARIPRSGKVELTNGEGYPVVPANWPVPRTHKVRP